MLPPRPSQARLTLRPHQTGSGSLLAGQIPKQTHCKKHLRATGTVAHRSTLGAARPVPDPDRGPVTHRAHHRRLATLVLRGRTDESGQALAMGPAADPRIVSVEGAGR